MSYTLDAVTQLELNLLGIPQVFFEGERIDSPPPKVLALLCYLTMQNESVARATVAELLWGDASRLVNVRMALSEFRQLPEVAIWLRTEGQQLKVSLQTDVKRFEDALRSENFAEAINIFQGEAQKPKTFLKGFETLESDEFQNWLELERSRLHQLYLEALQAHLEQLEATHVFEEAIGLANNLLAQDPLNEDVHRAVMRLEHKRGNDEAALAQFETLRKILKDELQVEPLSETLELLKEIEQNSLSKGKRAVLVKQFSDMPNLPEKLIGRESLIQKIQETLESHQQVLLQGLGGSGKTALAATVATQFIKHRKVLWLQAGDDSPEILFNAIAELFNLKQITPATLQQALDKNKIALLVLDDVWNAYALSKVLEAFPNQAILATSRQRYPNVKRIDIGRLERWASVDLLKHYAPFLLPSVTEEMGGLNMATNQLCELLGDHAFALRIAGMTLAVDGLQPQDLLERLQTAPHTLKTPVEFAEEGRESIVSLFNVSIKALSDEAYEALMGLGSLFTSSTTPELLALCLRRNEDDIENALLELQKRGLAERIASAGSDTISYQLHDLVFSFAKANRNLRDLSVMNACNVFLEKHSSHFQILDIELNSILGAVELAQKESDLLFVKMMQALVVGNAYYTARGHSPRSFAFHKEAAQVAKDLNDLEMAHYLLSKLGDVYREFYQDLDKALVSFEEALSFSDKLGNTTRSSTILSLIGITYFEKDDDKNADRFLQRAYQLASTSNDYLTLGHVLQHLGYVAGSRKNWQETFRCSREAVEVSERIQQDTAEVQYLKFFSLLNLGEAERKLGDFEGSLQHRLQALSLATLQNNEVWMAYALQEIGEMYHAVENRLQAQENYHKALGFYEQNNASADYEKLASFLKEAGYAIHPKAELVLSS